VFKLSLLCGLLFNKQKKCFTKSLHYVCSIVPVVKLLKRLKIIKYGKITKAGIDGQDSERT